MHVVPNATVTVEPRTGQGGRGDVFGTSYSLRVRLQQQTASSSVRDDKRSAPAAQQSVSARWEITYRRGALAYGADGEAAPVAAGSRITLPDGSTITALRTVPLYANTSRPWAYKTIGR